MATEGPSRRWRDRRLRLGQVSSSERSFSAPIATRPNVYAVVRMGSSEVSPRRNRAGSQVCSTQANSHEADAMTLKTSRRQGSTFNMSAAQPGDGTASGPVQQTVTTGTSGGSETGGGPAGAQAAKDASDSRHSAKSASRRLKVALVAIDSTAIALAYGTVLAITQGLADWRGAVRFIAAVGIAVIGGFWALRSQGLHRARISEVRVIELTRLTRAVAILAVVVLAAQQVVRTRTSIREICAASAGTFLILVLGRSAYRTWLSGERRAGRHCRGVLVIGTDDEARRIIRIATTHPEHGTRVLGVVGDRRRIDRLDPRCSWLGDVDDIERIVDEASEEITGVVVSTGAFTPGELNSLLRRLQHRRLHLFLATGLTGIDARRVQSVPMCHEPLLHVDTLTLSRSQTAVKRTVDIVLAGAALVMTAPVMLVAALLIRVGDGGPALYRQRRVGRDGREFDVLKLRTMVLGADRKLGDLAASNERQGPLFKMQNDPRVTRIGRFLRESSLDEVPQLVNVLRGDMSLVGPRPALPSEVERFSPEVRRREQVMPGITGLWQVEARDNPDFDAYERLDLFYVENWCILLDVMILMATAEHIIARLVSIVTHAHRKAGAGSASSSHGLARQAAAGTAE